MTYTTFYKADVKLQLAFIGTGWIGLNRMKALLDKNLCNVIGICEPVPENAARARTLATEAVFYPTIDELIAVQPDGIVIATPNALHHEQAIKALENGIAVFCQKPLARTSGEGKTMIQKAKSANRLLGVDMSYRFTDGMKKIYELVQENATGKIFAAELTFHNAYGPDKQWFYDPALSGGGCVLDLGIHLIDLALWILDYPEIKKVDSAMFSKGDKITAVDMICEDYAVVDLIADSDASVRLNCSWNLNAGKDAEIKAVFYGTNASVVFENINGSFYDFQASFCQGTSKKIISSPPDDWGGKALISWTNQLQKSSEYHPEIEKYIVVSEIIDKIYGRSV